MKKTVLLALSDAHHGYFQGVARYAREHQWHLVTDMIYTARIPIGWRGDGIVSFMGYRDDLAEFILSAKLPTVEISMVRNDIILPRVEADNEMIGRLAADHFLERGFKHFAWSPLMEDIVNAERFRGFSSRIEMNELYSHILPAAVSISSNVVAQNWAERRKMLINELNRLPKPLAVFGYNDCVAADIIDVCEEAGIMVPEAVSVMGVDNDATLCECLRIPLSSICHDLDGMAYRAAEMLDLIMSGGSPPENPPRVPPKGLITRLSTDIMAINNEPVLTALRYIAEHYANPTLGVDKIVEMSGVSRRSLEKLFRIELRRTVNEEILRVRLLHANSLLKSTEKRINDVALLSGFTHPNHFHRVFRKRQSMTPREYRNVNSVK